MKPLLTSDFFTQNRQTLRAAVGPDTTIVITGNGNMQRAADEPTKFHQDSNFWYLTGLSSAGLVLVMEPQATYVIAPTLSVERAAFDGAIDVAHLAKRSGITDVLDMRTGWHRLRETLQRSAQAATLFSPPAVLRRHDLHTLPYRRDLIAKLKRTVPGIVLRDVREELAALRVIKQPVELATLQSAIDITTETLQTVRDAKALAGVRYEYELEAAISYGFRSSGSDGHAFSPIVGAGAHATTLHHIDNNGPVAQGDMIVLDVGASVEHYAADISRTVVVGKPSKRQQAVYDAVLDVQAYALDMLRPGTLPRDYEQAVATYTGKKLQALGLITHSSPEAIRHYFPHATSHFLGLDVHDVGDYSLPLAEHMVLTCEPGIYIPEERIGVRIEDDVLITKTGNRVLSAACSNTLA